jgi:hypothetical protein
MSSSSVVGVVDVTYVACSGIGPPTTAAEARWQRHTSARHEIGLVDILIRGRARQCDITLNGLLSKWFNVVPEPQIRPRHCSKLFLLAFDFNCPQLASIARFRCRRNSLTSPPSAIFCTFSIINPSIGFPFFGPKAGTKFDGRKSRPKAMALTGRGPSSESTTKSSSTNTRYAYCALFFRIRSKRHLQTLRILLRLCLVKV